MSKREWESNKLNVQQSTENNSQFCGDVYLIAFKRDCMFVKLPNELVIEFDLNTGKYRILLQEPAVKWKEVRKGERHFELAKLLEKEVVKNLTFAETGKWIELEEI